VGPLVLLRPSTELVVVAVSLALSACATVTRSGDAARVGRNAGLGEVGTLGVGLDQALGGAKSSGQVSPGQGPLGPVVTVTAPRAGARVLDAEIEVEGMVHASAAPVGQVKIAVNDRKPEQVEVAGDGGLRHGVELDMGLNVVHVLAKDVNGIESEALVKVQRVASRAEVSEAGVKSVPVQLGRKGPVLEIRFPGDGEETNKDWVLVVGKITSEAGVSRVEIFVNGKKVSTSATRGLGPGGAGQIALNERAPLERGANVITVSAYDAEGGIAQEVRRVTYSSAAVQTARPPTGETPEAGRIARAYRPEYRRRVAAVIGINDYEHWPVLEGATSDARRVAAALRKMGFDDVIEIYDRQASRQRILRLLGTDLATKTGADDLAVIFFAGHGQTETLPGGEKRGYIIPVDAEREDVFSTAISMEQLRDLSSRLPAKHIYYAMDSCYSGLGFVRSAPRPANTGAYLQKMLSMRAVQMITAGLAGEEATERGGRGLFTAYFLRALEGEADSDGDGVVTASEIGTFVRPQVTAASGSRQTPQYGTIDGSGEVLFTLH